MQPMFKRLDLYNEEMEKTDSPVQSAMLDEIATEILKHISTLNIYQVLTSIYSYITYCIIYIHMPA